MSYIEDLLATLADGPVLDVRIGISWTAVAVEVAGQVRCGLAASVRGQHRHGKPTVRAAGQLTECSGRELAELAGSSSPVEVSIGFAAINALLPRHENAWVEVNASDVIAQRGRGKRVALVGHFPFVAWLRERVGTLWVLELNPREGDLPASAASQVVPQADVLALTGSTLLNGTFERLMALRKPGALALLLGPSTPLSPVLFDYGVHLLAGAVVEDHVAVLRMVSQGANFRQVRRAGVRLVTIRAQVPVTLSE